ncbi:hypothetical protein A4G26_04895 [Mycobacterium kansasii]|uniref:Uncharacterized protein n=1 Tax=Mycobacterium innocens TaxID=2341083 RepID=A0A498PW79_9MYCO|nr:MULTISPECIES: hypothetical protein [Mycobacterium]KZS75733.1 hypothetical protein A4G26_04895 [Mycobacterium kansasii]VBA38006.1 hypothetical protein LAUMK13_01914 [Mycobacterium innocens]
MTGNLSSLFPWHAEWWRTHEKMPPTLVLRCGINGCGSRVGEVKTDGDDVIALMLTRFGERTVTFTPRVTEESLGFPPGTVLRDAKIGETLAEQQTRKFEELDAETIRYVGPDTRVAKRYNAASVVIPIEVLGYIVCPVHGLVDVPDPDATVADIRRILAGATHATRRQYVIFRDDPVD